MHWHPYFEIATAQSGVLEYQVGQTYTILEPGDSIFVNQNILHGIWCGIKKVDSLFSRIS